ncbi:hypothetical protein DFH06DRAFT_1463759 [Mycena polygramma]|nr:hypothetical protein DFH06DRAFT_1463759 [Mycena polygramma]
MVHRALLPKNFSRLQPHLLVSAAVHGTAKDLFDLCVEITTLPRDQRVLLLPVFFIHLNPSLIPHVGLLDADDAGDDLRIIIERAIESLDGLAHLSGSSSIPLAAAPDLWTCVWPWAEFLQLYWEYLPGVPRAEKINNCMAIATVVTVLGQHSGAAKFIGQTHGVRNILAQVWIHILCDDELSSWDGSLEEVDWLLRFLATNLQESQNLCDILDGVGGEHSLVSGLLKHMAHACAFLPSRPAIVSLAAAFKFMELLTKYHVKFRSLLSEGGVTVAVTTTLATVSDSSPSTLSASATVHLCFILLERYLRVFPDTAYVWLSRALEAGLLRFILSFGITPPATGDSLTDMSAVLKELFVVLTNGLTSYRVVNRMKTELLDAVEAEQSAEFRECPLFAHWGDFTALAEWRIQVLDAGRSVLRACDNMKCGVLRPRNEFKYCSTCLSAAYCSQGCQIMDWRDSHRDECNSWRTSRSRRTLPSRERTFIHTFLHADYMCMRSELARRTIDFVAEFPNQPFYAEWDYRAPNTQPTVEIHPRDHIESDDCAAELEEMEWDLHWQRMARSAGRMRLNVVILSQGCIVIPTRSSAATFRDGMIKFGNEIHERGRGEGVAGQIDERIRDLIQSVDDDPHFVEIH